MLLIALPAAVAVWSGWVGLGELTGFGVIHPMPGIWDPARLNTGLGFQEQSDHPAVQCPWRDRGSLHRRRSQGDPRAGRPCAGRDHGEPVPPRRRKVFWDVKDPAKAVVIELADERYARLVVQVDDPSATVALVENALR
ncbi:hypothetical protein [Nocardia vermiculata]|uniref:hypothetical protein n=1 Tax=Nocardia vermiculata TaxID=257274 RepID=UPI000B15D07D|nr:hypothetical protein [Nocardia vermiculata]